MEKETVRVSYSPSKSKTNADSKQSDRSSSDYHETTVDKLDGSGDNTSIPQISISNLNSKSSGSRNSIEGSFDQSLDSLIGKLTEKPSSRNSEPNLLEVSGKSSVLDSGSKSGTDDTRQKKKRWYAVLNPTYKSKMAEFRKVFKDIPKEERLLVDYSCAYQKDILIQGRMYLSQNWICFYANIFTWETVLMVPCKAITTVTKEKTARVIPNAIQITTSRDKLFFTSFTSRDKAYLMIFRIWQNALLDKQMSSKELWHWVHSSYGNELGLASDDEHRSLSGFDDTQDKISDTQCSPSFSSKHNDQVVENGKDSLLTPDGTVNSHQRGHHDLNSSVGSLDTSVTADKHRTDDIDSSGADSAGEVVCADHEHLSQVYLNETFSLPVDKVFEFLFSDSKFFRDFCASRKTFNLNLPDWQSEPNADGNREREIRYTLTLSASIGPKYSPSYERQVYHGESQPGFIYIIDVDCHNGGIPYADAFYVTNRYCLTRITRNACRVRVTSELKYNKSIWSLVKNMIEKNARHGLTVYFQMLESHLRREAKKYEPHISPSHLAQKKPGRRRRKATDPSSGEFERLSNEQAAAAGSKGEGMFGLSAENLVRLLCFVLLLLFLFNAIIFYKIFYIESVASSVHYSSFLSDLEQLHKSSPESSNEWISILTKQQNLHAMEVKKWQDVLSGAVAVLDQIKETLVGLKEMLDQRRSMESTYSSSADSVPT